MMRMIVAMKTGIQISAELGGDCILYSGILMGEETQATWNVWHFLWELRGLIVCIGIDP